MNIKIKPKLPIFLSQGLPPQEKIVSLVVSLWSLPSRIRMYRLQSLEKVHCDSPSLKFLANEPSSQQSTWDGRS